jgi:hypothetical protein
MPRQRSISAARPSLGSSSRSSGMNGIDGRTLRIHPVEFTLKISGFDLAARQRHSLENPLVPECRFLIGPFRRAGALARALLVRVPVPFSHTK